MPIIISAVVETIEARITSLSRFEQAEIRGGVAGRFYHIDSDGRSAQTGE